MSSTPSRAGRASRLTFSTVPWSCARDPDDGTGRTAYFAGDVDRRAWHDNSPDDLDLLGAAVRWVEEARGGWTTGPPPCPVQVTGPGLVDVAVYEQPERGRLVVQVVNLTHGGTWKGPLTELLPLAGQRLRIGPAGRVQRVCFLVSGIDVAPGGEAAGGEAPGAVDSSGGGHDAGPREWPVPPIVDREIAIVDIDIEDEARR